MCAIPQSGKFLEKKGTKIPQSGYKSSGLSFCVAKIGLRWQELRQG